MVIVFIFVKRNKTPIYYVHKRASPTSNKIQNSFNCFVAPSTFPLLTSPISEAVPNSLPLLSNFLWLTIVHIMNYTCRVQFPLSPLITPTPPFSHSHAGHTHSHTQWHESIVVGMLHRKNPFGKSWRSQQCVSLSWN